MGGADEGRVPGLTPRHRSALLWGAVGAMAFLVLVQAYSLLVDSLLSPMGRATAALLVGAGAAGAAYALEPRIAEWAARRATE